MDAEDAIRKVKDAIKSVEVLGPVQTNLPTPVDSDAGKAYEALSDLRDALGQLELIGKSTDQLN